MRTILIPLILICSLTQFESVQAGKKNRIKVQGCGRLISDEQDVSCYVPEICTNVSLEGKSISEGGVQQIFNDTEITEDCPAILRFYDYRQLMEFSLESFQDLNNVNSLQFFERELEYEKHTFYCNVEDGKVVGRHAIFGKNSIVKYIEDKLPNKLSCKFEVKISKYLNKNTDLIRVRGVEHTMHLRGDFHDMLSFVIGEIETKRVKSGDFGLRSPYSCNPEQLYFNTVDAIETDKYYEKVQYKGRKYYCNDFFETELRKNGTYEVQDKLECTEKGIFKPLEETEKFADDLDVRCAADVKYFCDYDVKIKQGEISPIRVKPSWNPKRESSLKCPPEKPHLIVVKERSEKQIPNAKIECRKYGVDQFWTVDGEILYEDGPGVYCTDTVKCSRLHKIPASSVKNGFLDKKDFLPRCHKGGELYVDDKKVLSKECDSTDGKFKYSVEEGVKLNIDEGTKFVCKYP